MKGWRGSLDIFQPVKWTEEGPSLSKTIGLSGSPLALHDKIMCLKASNMQTYLSLENWHYFSGEAMGMKVPSQQWRHIDPL